MGTSIQSRFTAKPSTATAPANVQESLIASQHTDRRTLGIIALMVGVICWGVSPVLLRALTPYVDAWTANGLRYPMAAVLYWPLLFMAFQSKRLTLELLRRCTIPAAFAFGGQVFWALAHYELQASEIGFLVRLSMVWAIIGSMWMFRDERKLLFLPGFHLGVTLIAIGFVVMTYAGRESETALTSETIPSAAAGGNHLLGVIWILLCSALFGLYMVAVRRCISNVDPLLAFGVVANFVSVGTIAGMFMFGDVGLIKVQTATTWMLIAASSLLGIALGHIMMYTAVQRLGAAISSSCQTLMPFLTAAIAGVSLAEALTTGQWLGGSVMVVGAIMLLSLKHEISENPNETGPSAEA